MSHFSVTRPPTPPRSPDLLTLREAADALRVTESTARRWAKAGRVPAVRLPGPNGKLLIPREAVEQLTAVSEVSHGA